WRLKTALLQQIQYRVIIFRHDARRSHGTARVTIHDLVRFDEMRPRPLHEPDTDFGDRRARYHGGRIGAVYTGAEQFVARQVQPADRGVLVEVTQDVRQLQGAAKMVAEQDAVLLRQAEHPDRQPS